MIQALPLAAVDAAYRQRDRTTPQTDELDALVASIRDRGQQTPIEVVALGADRYGLISGWRRLTALRQLHTDAGGTAFGTVLAVLRQPDSAADAYVAMVEENEIRLGLSYYERARIAAKAVEQGVFEAEKQALQSLFSTASRAKRSKIKSFLTLYHAADPLLKFPAAIPERLGVALARALEEAPDRPERLGDMLRAAPRQAPDAELAVLHAALARFSEGQARPNGSEADPKPSPPSSSGREQAPAVTEPAAMRVTDGVALIWTPERLVLQGRAVDAAFQRRLVAWIKAGRG